MVGGLPTNFLLTHDSNIIMKTIQPNKHYYKKHDKKKYYFYFISIFFFFWWEGGIKNAKLYNRIDICRYQ